MFDKNGRFGADKDRLLLKEEYFSTVWVENVPECRKFYFPHRCAEGYAGYEYNDGRKFIIEFDKDKIPYLGVWLNYGFISGYYCAGIEPCSVGYDSIVNAKEYGQSHKIVPKERFSFTIYLSVK